MPTKDKPPNRLSIRLAGAFGPQAAGWVADLPALIDEMGGRWNFEPGAPFVPSAYSYATAVRCSDGSEAVLKLRYPGRAAALEIDALRDFGGVGAARLLRSDPEKGALLLEKVEPGHDAVDLSDRQAVQALGGVMEKLHTTTAASRSYPTTSDWGGGFERYRAHHAEESGPIPGDLFRIAEGLYADLEASAAGPVLLHGDLHHQNLLFDHRRGWLAVDPQGVMGEPAYEVGAFLRNPISRLAGRSDLTDLVRQRIDLLSSACRFSANRILGWGLSQAVLSAIWALEDREPDVDQRLEVAQALEAVWQVRQVR